MNTNLDFKKIKEYGNLELLAKQMVEGFITGLHKSPYHGFSVEFAEHRLYNTGESTRHIDWKVFAKTDRLFVKRYEEETNLRCLILIDNSSSMYYPAESHDKINFSIFMSACLTYMLQRQRDAVGVAAFSETIDFQTAIKSTPSHLHYLLLQLQEMLATQTLRKRTAAAATIHQIADQVHRRSLIVIFSDMLENVANQDEIFAALQHLKHNLHEVLLFHVTDKKTEIDFDFAERPYEFEDLESGEKVKLHPSQVKQYYQQQVQQRFQDLKMKCGQYKIDFIEADTNMSVDQILLPYLIKRGKMK